MKKLTSKIHTLFSDEILKLIASVCDSRSIDSYQDKMVYIQQILKRYNIKFRMLGGATNRLTLMIDGYAIKFAIDRQGYKDNLMEYALSRELQPYVTKTYETNGYIVVSECVKTMTLDDFKLLKVDICRILDILARDYLLGDVGYIKKNFANWGIRDNGEVVILDYAYCHRATEKLFSCDVCGEGVLRYDSTYSYLMCSNRGVCDTKYTYMERKAVQGDQVDLDMIEEAKGESFELPKNKKFVELTDDNMDANVVIVDTYDKYVKYLKEDANMLGFDSDEALSLMIKKSEATTPEEKLEIERELDKLIVETDEYQDKPKTVIQYEEPENEDDVDDEDTSDSSYALSIKDMLDILNNSTEQVEMTDEDKEVIDTINQVINEPCGSNVEEVQEEHQVETPEEPDNANITSNTDEQIDESIPETKETITSEPVVKDEEKSLDDYEISKSVEPTQEDVDESDSSREEAEVNTEEETEVENTEKESTEVIDDEEFADNYTGILVNDVPVAKLGDGDE